MTVPHTTVGPAQVPRHWLRMVVIWAVLSAVAVPLIVLVLGPHLPPGRMTAEAGSQRDANTVMTALLAPIVVAVLVFFVYAIVVFRERGTAIVDGPPLRGHVPMQTAWVVFTSVIVIALAAWGSYTLIVSSHGAGGGQGPDPVAVPSHRSQDLVVQVIGQQWNWTYRFPKYDDVETDHLELPDNSPIELHVTSLDVTHSFWAYQLGVKADAVPGADNVAFVHTRNDGTFNIRCAELCGLWHGHMYQTGDVVSPAAFKSWISSQQTAEAPNLRYLPPFGRTYYPAPFRRAG
jgi:cytochrome c oxidase subunit 2